MIDRRLTGAVNDIRVTVGLSTLGHSSQNGLDPSGPLRKDDNYHLKPAVSQST